jgi:hypothetical protein
MFKALGALVLAMSGVSSLLSWLDPSGPASTPTASAAELLALARSVVLDGTEVEPARWQAIEIVAVPPGAAPGRLLRAAPDRRESHFAVDDLGHPRRLARWREQSTVASSTGAVRIEVVQTDLEAPMTAAQWASLQALIVTINEQVHPTGASLPIRLAGEWARVYGLDEGALLALATAR